MSEPEQNNCLGTVIVMCCEILCVICCKVICSVVCTNNEESEQSIYGISSDYEQPSKVNYGESVQGN